MINLNSYPMKMKQNIKHENNNPWIVSSIFDFQFFCCPECDEKLQEKQDFINHASFHSEVSFATCR